VSVRRRPGLPGRARTIPAAPTGARRRPAVPAPPRAARPSRPGQPGQGQMAGPEFPGAGGLPQAPVPGSLMLQEKPSVHAGHLVHRRPAAATRGCEDRSVASHHCRGRPTRCIRLASSRRGTAHPPGPPGSAWRAPAPRAGRPSPATPRWPSATPPPMRPRPRPGRPSTTACCQTGGHRPAPTVTGARTPATPGRCASARPMAGRPPRASRPARDAGRGGTDGAPARRSPRKLDLSRPRLGLLRPQQGLLQRQQGLPRP
jgi:hypothetical protein